MKGSVTRFVTLATAAVMATASPALAVPDFASLQIQQYDPPRPAPAFSLPEGGTSEPVESPLGYHVLRVDSRQAATTPSFEEASAEIRDRLARERRAAAELAYVAGVMARSKVNHAAALRTPRS